jgi:hypothetical protein
VKAKTEHMKEIFHLIAKQGVSPNGLFVLHCMRDNYLMVDYINHKYEQYKLEINGFLTSDKSTGTPVYKISSKGFDLLRQVDELYGSASANKTETKKKKQNKFEEWKPLITQFNEYFPKGKKVGSSVSFRTTPKELYERFEWFFEEYPEYTWEQVLFAAEKYAEEFDKTMDYQYMQTSKYFIKKEDKNKTVTSTLATMCYNIAEGNHIDIDDGRYYFGP